MAAMTARRLVLVVRADPVICGHSGEARNLAEAALARGFDDVRIVTWPLDVLERSGLPLKPLDGVLPYSPGITVERPAPVGDYKVPDGRWLAGLTGRLVELFTDGVPTLAMSLYLTPHATAVTDAVRIARATGLPVNVTTIAEAVGSDVTNVVRAAVEADQFGAAAQVLATYLEHDVCLAVSAYTREVILAEATELDARHGTRFAPRLAERVAISYPAIDTASYIVHDESATDRELVRRGLVRDGYVLFLSRLAHAKGVDDLIEAFCRSRAAAGLRLVVAGTGPQGPALRAQAAASAAPDRIVFLDDVDDDEKVHLMAGCAAFALPSKPRPEFTETFGIALVEKMLAGGGPVITTATGGIGEAVGYHAVIVPAGDPAALADALDQVLQLSPQDRAHREHAARDHARQFDRTVVLDAILDQVEALSRVRC
jgi:glycosyltransferase involved in cell wall biosynthesis